LREEEEKGEEGRWEISSLLLPGKRRMAAEKGEKVFWALEHCTAFTF
jgi:hypothetical protein